MLQRVSSMLREHLGDKDKNLSGVLGQVLRLLNLSDGGYDRDRLRQALTYIGSLPVAASGVHGVNKRVSLISVLEKSQRGIPLRDQFVFDRYHLEKMKNPTLKEGVFVAAGTFSGKARQLLADLYFEVLKEYHRQAWVYEYPAGAFHGWEYSMASAGNKDEAIRDFQRDVALGGVSGGSHDEVLARLGGLVAAVDASLDEREKFAAWLRNNGGQKTSSFLTEMVTGDHFSDGSFMLVNSQSMAGWSVEDGRLVNHFNLLLGAVQLDGRYLAATKDGSIVSMDELPEAIVAEHSSIKSANVERRRLGKAEVFIPSVLQMKGSIVLELNDKGQVQPRMASCKVMSHSPDLLSPARLFDKLQDIQRVSRTPG